MLHGWVVSIGSYACMAMGEMSLPIYIGMYSA